MRARRAVASQLLAAARERRLILAPADVGDDEHVQHHHCARIHDHLHGGHELGAQQQEQHGERDEVGDEREHAEECVAQHDHAAGTGDRPEGGDEEQRLAHSPSLRSGVRSSGSASSISFVKMRSERS